MDFGTIKPLVKLPTYRDGDDLNAFLRDFENRMGYFEIYNNYERSLYLEDCVRGSHLELLLRKHNSLQYYQDMNWPELSQRIRLAVEVLRVVLVTELPP